MTLPLLLLPGLISDARIFAAQLARFPQAIAVDGLGPLASLQAMAERTLEHAPERFALLGHSMGGRVALEVVRRAPDRVVRLALLSTGIHQPRPGEAESRHALRDVGRAEDAAALVDRWLPPMLAPAHRDDPAILQPLRAMCIGVGVEDFAAQSEAMLSRPPVDDLLPRIACPTLVITGAEDAWSPPAQHEAIAALIPDARLAIIPGAGHMLPAEAPDALNELIAAWLTEG
ncbi:alpha/beta fold hydrolase [Sphingomonas nostoxanthinifaciens]|uniref:alpha/beta fold hydrolase n=1 Tax=Sphingomonas nostoxanthinifaciens TaxID=2872652 RepID=UPI001CC21695|nr:alpha/beta fold hydrolase [Sphingomonas nostoxanthinifaciens]UAK26071.1 alpha/beta hydrolase [Sphingomonas nostoxanthinifaciens]